MTDISDPWGGTAIYITTVEHINNKGSVVLRRLQGGLRLYMDTS